VSQYVTIFLNNMHKPFLALAVFTLATYNVGLADGGFYGDPPDATHPWTIHDPNRPKPIIVAPGTNSTPEKPGQPPADATVLFDGTAESLVKNWLAEDGQPTKWVVKEGAMECVPGSGYVKTKGEFGDIQLHVEWAAPAKVEGSSQGRGNSGVFLPGGVECQVLDNYNNPTYADGYASSIYGVNPPMVNALRAPGEWQSYDIIYRKPVYKDGKALDTGYVTVIVNGILTQDHTPLEGGTGHRSRTKVGPLPEKGVLKFQDHGNPVRFRNVWLRELPARISQGGMDGGFLSAEVAMDQREKTAASIREDAGKLNGNAKMLRMLESLVYAPHDATLKEGTALVDAFLATAEKSEGDKMKGDVKHVASALKYLAKFKIADLAALKGLEKLIADRGWEDKKK
jgi:hypothetical protein